MSELKHEVVQVDRKLGYGDTKSPPTSWHSNSQSHIAADFPGSAKGSTGITGAPGSLLDQAHAPQPSIDSKDCDDQKVHPRNVPVRSGLTEIVLNYLSGAGFVVGSSFWCWGDTTLGSIVFGVACIFGAIAQAIYGYKFFRKDDFISSYAAFQSGCGCVIFTVGSFLYLDPAMETFCLLTFLFGSIVFLTACGLTQVQQRSWLGVMAPLFPRTPRIIPTGLFNTLGSVLFILGSIFLFYKVTAVAGAWCYEIGSIIFWIASWGDAVLWWSSAPPPCEPSLWNDYRDAVLTSPSKVVKISGSGLAAVAN